MLSSQGNDIYSSQDYLRLPKTKYIEITIKHQFIGIEVLIDIFSFSTVDYLMFHAKHIVISNIWSGKNVIWLVSYNL